MPLTPEQIAKIRQKEAELGDALKRDPNVNYYEGWFFVTLNTRGEVPVLSSCVGDVRLENGEEGAPHCEYTELGLGVIEAWKDMPAIHPNVEIDKCEVMPEHFHGLVHLSHGNKKHLGHIIGGFMVGCTHAYWDTLGIDWQSNRYDKGAAAFKIERDPDHTSCYNAEKCALAQKNVLERLNVDDKGIGLDHIGSIALLAADRKLPLICHLGDAHLFDRRKLCLMLQG